jgi:hypothetical protein
MIRSAIAFGIQAIGCLYVSYWAIFFGSAAFLIITFYLQEHKHHPVGKAALHEGIRYDAQINSQANPKGIPPRESRTTGRAGG